MSAAEKAEKATEKATEVVTDAAADVAAEVAQQAEQMEKFIRSMNKVKVQYGLMGAALGTAIGAAVSFAVAYRRAQTKYSKLADEEISEMRQHYMEKGKALESEAAKRPLDEIVEEQGYSSAEIEDTPPPMVVKPPTPEKVDNIEVVDPPDAEVVRNIFTDTEVTHEWDWHAERRSRSPDVPYVIHYDEQHEMDYQIVTVTYYEGDDVLCYDNDEVIDPDKRDEIIGEGNLDRFGHGSNDAAIVYIRNDKLELVFEVVRSPNHYAEEVHGFQHTEYGGNLERMRVRERDEQDD